MDRRLGFVCLALSLLSCAGNQPGLRWVVPEKFNGCIAMEFNVAGAPALPLEDGKFTLAVPEQSGAFQTSTEPRWGEGLRIEHWRQVGQTRERIEPTCEMAGTLNHVERGTLTLVKCFGQVSRSDCELAGQGRVK
ncbi:hypothetical protein HPC49_08770 [Pyxidicoccus fallax]|uniref:Lipoprotein n=1 Tax=Pyxidicoccus fallax TaxID=394095 RepID=A0A848LEN0_9BACT|nr:hypothetical protein [Pyxidicoccus fallax]NMO13938.1 hypothetical protein [Pyxidicoccus fallax]NPC78337.1 hypothetical protein [Pyxidicoccus fallax]